MTKLSEVRSIDVPSASHRGQGEIILVVREEDRGSAMQFNRHRWERKYCIAVLFPIKNLLPNEESISRRGSVLAVRHTKTTG